MSADFRDHLYDIDHPRLVGMRGLDARQYREHATHDPFTGPMIEGWAALYPEPFTGVTSDGTLTPEIFDTTDVRGPDRAPAGEMVAAARRLLAGLTPARRDTVRYELGAHEWRSWANPEFMQHDTGLRLEDLEPETIDLCLAVVEASTSADGYRFLRELMSINAFMGDLVELPALLGEFSYHFSIFGEPDDEAPWGWSLFGHHVAVSCLVAGGRMSMTPTFLGAEPSIIDEGPLAGTRAFADRIRTARRLISALPDEQREAVRTYPRLVDPAMPEGRIHPGDERHLAGAFQDNRVIPYEGAPVSEFPPEARQAVLELAEQFHALMPRGPRSLRLAEIESHLDRTWFSWIGGFGADDPFYFRIQSPVTILELDHHRGVFLANDTAMPFHIHTVMRTPHGNDYGRLYTAARLDAGARLPGDIA